ncbi:MAG: HEAT repeat domain-containing protein [Rubripirellula sp.]
MFQRLCRSILLTSSCLVVFSPLPGEEVDTVAGHSLEHYVDQLPSADRVVRLRAARSLLPFGDRAGEALRAALDHEDPAVRYIAAESLGRIGGDALEQSVGRLCELAEDESSHAVRVAASFALCRHGLTDPHLDLMIETLDYPERGMACNTAFLIGEIGPDASEAKEALQRTLDQNRPGGKVGDYHLGGSALNALRKLSRSGQR